MLTHIMKICVTIVGVCRPSFERVRTNIENNIKYFTTTYPQHQFTFMLLAYKNTFYTELQEYCDSIKIQSYFIEHIKESDFVFPIIPRLSNMYRLFYSMNYMLDKVPVDMDCVIRIRLDTEIVNLEIPDTVTENSCYIVQESDKRYSDNLMYGSYNVMKSVWAHKNCLISSIGQEEIIYTIVRTQEYDVKRFKFHYRLYQSSDTVWDGVAQWSKRSREWIYDGNTYILRDL